jgi:serine/threonine-protein kinase
MSLPAGTRLAAYEILTLIGSGGMGEVYRAKDTKLGRDVALKMLPTSFTNDPERVARFRREAQVLASLNHPHLAQIYGLEQANGTQFLVLELVDGESLDKRIAHGPIPVDEALGIAKEIAEALEAAHERGVIHRDLKPANIALTHDGNVKVLDFGLAKAVAATSGSVDAMNSPTITSPAMMTGVGVILGTAAYMSPEQAKGRHADKRSDVWAFGCVLYEMLTGRRPFEGDDVSDTLAAVLRGEPDWTALPNEMPEHIRLLLHRCLEKDPRKRVSDVGIARFLMTEASLSSGHASEAARLAVGRRWRTAVVPVTAAMLVASLGLAIWVTRPQSAPLIVTRFTVLLPADERFSNLGRHSVAISPDGTRIAYVANQRLYMKAMWDVDARQLVPLSANGLTSPVFSPDGQWIAYWVSPGSLNKVSITGGAPVKLADLDNPFGLSWSGDSLLVGQGPRGIVRVPDAGGRPEVVIQVKGDEIAHGPQLLPDGRSVLFTVALDNDRARWDNAQLVVQAMRSTDRKTIVRGGADGRYLRSGHLVYLVGGVLFAEPFDVHNLEGRGSRVSVLEGVSRSLARQTGSGNFAVSDTGTLAYIPGPAAGGLAGSAVALLDQQGRIEMLPLPARAYQSPRFSPSGRQLALGVDDGRDANILVYDLDNYTQPRQLTLGADNRFPIWTADGARITFRSDRENDRSIVWQRADGRGAVQPLIKAAEGEYLMPNSWSPDGDTLLFTSRTGTGPYVLSTFTLHDKRRLPFADVRSSNQPSAGFSRDGHWVTYSVGNGLDGGGASIHVRPFPVTDEDHVIGPGVSPFWARNAMKLYFVTSPGVSAWSVVTVATEPTFGVSAPSAVPRPAIVGGGPNVPRAYDIAPDGQHLVVLTAPDAGEVRGSQIQFVLNWTEELKQRVPTK